MKTALNIIFLAVTTHLVLADPSNPNPPASRDISKLIEKPKSATATKTEVSATSPEVTQSEAINLDTNFDASALEALISSILGTNTNAQPIPAEPPMTTGASAVKDNTAQEVAIVISESTKPDASNTVQITEVVEPNVDPNAILADPSGAQDRFTTTPNEIKASLKTENHPSHGLSLTRHDSVGTMEDGDSSSNINLHTSSRSASIQKEITMPKQTPEDIANLIEATKQGHFGNEIASQKVDAVQPQLFRSAPVSVQQIHDNSQSLFVSPDQSDFDVNAEIQSLLAGNLLAGSPNSLPTSTSRGTTQFSNTATSSSASATSSFSNDDSSSALAFGNDFGAQMNDLMIDGTQSNQFGTQMNGQMVDGTQRNQFGTQMNGQMVDGTQRNQFGTQMNGPMIEGTQTVQASKPSLFMPDVGHQGGTTGTQHVIHDDPFRFNDPAVGNSLHVREGMVTDSDSNLDGKPAPPTDVGSLNVPASLLPKRGDSAAPRTRSNNEIDFFKSIGIENPNIGLGTHLKHSMFGNDDSSFDAANIFGPSVDIHRKDIEQLRKMQLEKEEEIRKAQAKSLADQRKIAQETRSQTEKLNIEYQQQQLAAQRRAEEQRRKNIERTNEQQRKAQEMRNELNIESSKQIAKHNEKAIKLAREQKRKLLEGRVNDDGDVLSPLARRKQDEQRNLEFQAKLQKLKAETLRAQEELRRKQAELARTERGIAHMNSMTRGSGDDTSSSQISTHSRSVSGHSSRVQHTSQVKTASQNTQNNRRVNTDTRVQSTRTQSSIPTPFHSGSSNDDDLSMPSTTAKKDPKIIPFKIVTNTDDSSVNLTPASDANVESSTTTRDTTRQLHTSQNNNDDDSSSSTSSVSSMRVASSRRPLEMMDRRPRFNGRAAGPPRMRGIAGTGGDDDNEIYDLIDMTSRRRSTHRRRQVDTTRNTSPVVVSDFYSDLPTRRVRQSSSDDMITSRRRHSSDDMRLGGFDDDWERQVRRAFNDRPTRRRIVRMPTRTARVLRTRTRPSIYRNRVYTVDDDTPTLTRRVSYNGLYPYYTYPTFRRHRTVRHRSRPRSRLVVRFRRPRRRVNYIL